MLSYVRVLHHAMPWPRRRRLPRHMWPHMRQGLARVLHASIGCRKHYIFASAAFACEEYPVGSRPPRRRAARSASSSQPGSSHRTRIRTGMDGHLSTAFLSGVSTAANARMQVLLCVLDCVLWRTTRRTTQGAERPQFRDWARSQATRKGGDLEGPVPMWISIELMHTLSPSARDATNRGRTVMRTGGRAVGGRTRGRTEA